MADDLGPEYEQSDDGLDGGLDDGQGHSLAGDHRRESAEEKAAHYRSRPDAAMVQAETSRASVKGKGLKCPKCHCQNFRVLATRPGEGSKTRRRICRSCGYVFHTCEFVTSDLTSDSILDEMIRKLQQ